MDEKRGVTGSASSERLVLPSLIISRCVTVLPLLITGLLLIDIGDSFNIPVGIVGQIRTAASSLGIIFSLLTGVLSLRFEPRRLLIAGLLVYSISAFTSGLVFEYWMLLILYSLTGLGFALVASMVTTSFGEYMPLEKRAGALGLMMSSLAIINLCGTIIINFINGLWGWRYAFLGFLLPLSIIALFLVLIGLPKSKQDRHNNTNYKESYKIIITNRSAAVCLLGTSLSAAASNYLYIYGASFWRQRFLVSTSFVSIIMIINILTFSFASLFSGRIINRFGRKPFTFLSVLLSGILILATTNMNSLRLSLVFGISASLFSGISQIGYTSLTLEQIPNLRGSMMSLSSAAIGLGQVLAGGLGGLVLLYFGYSALGVVLGVFGILGAFAFKFFTEDTTTFRK
jgi:predicted MFS family arabinose efflux permease